MTPARSTSVVLSISNVFLHVQCYLDYEAKATLQLNTKKNAPFEDFEVMERPFLKRQTLPGVVLIFCGSTVC